MADTQHHVLISAAFPAGHLFLEGQHYTIGRDGFNQIVLPSDFVSREHAVLKLRGRCLGVTDQHSTNGTFVNGQRADHAVLQDGDVIEVGPYRLTYRLVRDLEQIRKALSSREDFFRAAERKAGGSGVFSGLPFSEGDILRLLLHLEELQRTGVVRVAAAGRALQGRIYFVGGEVVRAEAGIFGGVDAVRQLATLTEGVAAFEKGPPLAGENMRIAPSRIFSPSMADPRPTDPIPRAPEPPTAARETTRMKIEDDPDRPWYMESK